MENTVAAETEQKRAEGTAEKQQRERKKRKRWTLNDWVLVGMASLSVVFLAIFAYAPLYGLTLAFKDGDGQLDIARAISSAPWCGFDNFANFISDPDFGNVMLNTIGLNVLQLCINFPLPILFAVLTAELISDRFKKIVQTVTFFPHFISWAIFGGIFLSILALDTGLPAILQKAGITEGQVDILGSPAWFWPLIICTSLLKGMGWGSVIYVAAIAAIPQELYEAAKMDGANRWHKIIYITLPSIAPTITLFFILSVSGILNNGVEHLLVFQNVSNFTRSEVLDTYVYKYGLTIHNGTLPQYSLASAIGLMKSVVGMLLLVGSNFVCKKITGKGIY